MKHFTVLDHPIRHSYRGIPPAFDLMLSHGNSFTVTWMRLQFQFYLNFQQSLGKRCGLRIDLSASLQCHVTLRANVILSIRVRSQFWDTCVRGQLAYCRREVGATAQLDVGSEYPYSSGDSLLLKTWVCALTSVRYFRTIYCVFRRAYLHITYAILRTELPGFMVSYSASVRWLFFFE